MRKHLVGLIVSAAAVSLGAASGCKKAPPPKPAPAVGPVEPNSFIRKSVAQIDLKGGERITRLHLGGKVLIAYTSQHAAYVLSQDGLSLLSVADVTSPATRLAAPVVLDEQIVYPTNTTLEVFDFRGRHVRSIDVERSMRSPITGKGKTLYMGVDYQGGGRVIALDLDLAAAPVRWEFALNSGIAAAPAVVNNTIYVGAEDGVLYAASDQGYHKQPREEFTFKTDGRIVADVKADEKAVHVASTDTKLYCLHPGTGKILWEYYAQAALTAAPVVTADRVYQAVPGVGLAAIDRNQGEFHRRPLWVSDAVTQILSEDDRNLYARLADDRIAAIDKRTGDRLFTSRRNDFAAFATNTKDATIYAATRDNKIYAITPVFRGGGVGEMVLDLDARELPAGPLAMK